MVVSIYISVSIPSYYHEILFINTVTSCLLMEPSNQPLRDVSLGLVPLSG